MPQRHALIETPGAGHALVETAGSTYRERLHEFYGPPAITSQNAVQMRRMKQARVLHTLNRTEVTTHSRESGFTIRRASSLCRAIRCGRSKCKLLFVLGDRGALNARPDEVEQSLQGLHGHIYLH